MAEGIASISLFGSVITLSKRKLRLERISFRSVSNEPILFVMIATQIVFARVITRMAIRRINRILILFIIGLNKRLLTRVYNKLTVSQVPSN